MYMYSVMGKSEQNLKSYQNLINARYDMHLSTLYLHNYGNS